MKLSVVIPAKDEAKCLVGTLNLLIPVLQWEKIRHEVIVVDDNSTDDTSSVLKRLEQKFPTLRVVTRKESPGFGRAVLEGIRAAQGDAIAIFMADNSDAVEDLVRFFRHMEKTKVDCVFGTRFSRGGKTIGYPLSKWILNRLVNKAISVVFRIPYDDVTNAFKLYRRSVFDLVNPLVSQHFNLCVEIPLKAILRGCRYEVLPNSWTNRRTGISKLKIKEMGSRYLYTILNCYLEKTLVQRDYVKRASRSPLPKASKDNVSSLYEYRFRNVSSKKKNEVWSAISEFIYRRTGRPRAVLDPAAGTCEFINAVPSEERWALDVSKHVAASAASGVTVKVGNALTTKLNQGFFDLVFVSNFLEHLREPAQITRLMEQMHSTLKDEGKIVVMGPNFRFCYKTYFDFADHHLPLTEKAVEEHLVNAGFTIERSYPQFLPFSFTGKLPASRTLTKIYLALPFAWKIFGKQFLIIAKKRSEAKELPLRKRA